MYLGIKELGSTLVKMLVKIFHLPSPHFRKMPTPFTVSQIPYLKNSSTSPPFKPKHALTLFITSYPSLAYLVCSAEPPLKIPNSINSSTSPPFKPNHALPLTLFITPYPSLAYIVCSAESLSP